MRSEFDYVIVGAGSAGCTLAYRLGEDPGVRVLVLEAGRWTADPWVRIPLGWGRILQERRHDWMYFAEPEASVDGRAIECARGKVVGGTSSINAMAYVRGHRIDYDRWAASGLRGWSYAHVLPYFRRQESWEGGASEYRGGDGPLATRTSRYADPLIDAYMAAGAAAGHPLTPDYNAAQQEGFARLQSTIRNGRRWSGADAFLRPAVARGNVSVAVNALATRVVFEGARAVGVEYVVDGDRRTARAAREVILAGGVINSPQLLMLSGIGDPEELHRHGIDVKVRLPGVGRNLQDHVCAAIPYSRRSPGPFVRNMRIDRLALALGQAWASWSRFRDRPAVGRGRVPEDQPGAWRRRTSRCCSTPARSRPGPTCRRSSAPFADGFSARAVLLRPESRGTLKLASADPAAPVRIHQNFLATDADWKVLRAGLRLLRDVGRQRAMAPFVGRELLTADDDAGLDAHIRATSITAHHPLGTCRMGVAGDPTAVVDESLRVFGTEGLRVVDGSVMPDLVGGNINAPIVMIAERAADLLRGRAPLAPARI